MGLRWLLFVTLASGCVHDDLVACGDQVCPIGYSCDIERSICALPNGLSIPNEISFDQAMCGQLSQGSFVVRNMGETEVPFDTILTDIGVTTVPASGSFPPGDTEVKMLTTVPLESLPGHVIEGSLFLPLAEGVEKRKLRVTPTGVALDISTHSLSFGETSVATERFKSVTYGNTGNVAVNLTAEVTPGPFSFTNSASLHLEPGDIRQLEVRFVSNSVQAYSGSLNVSPDAVICQMPLDSIPIDAATTTDALLLDSLTMDFGDVACNQPLVQQALEITNTNASAQDITTEITGPNADDYGVMPASSTIAGNAIESLQVTRGVTFLEATGPKSATLAITGTLPTLTTNKQVSLVHRVVGSELVALSPCVELGELIPPHSSAMGNFQLFNAGNATGPVVVTTRPSDNVSPSMFQIAPNASVNLAYVVANNSSFYLSPQGLFLGLIDASNDCRDKIVVTGCGGEP